MLRGCAETTLQVGRLAMKYALSTRAIFRLSRLDEMLTTTNTFGNYVDIAPDRFASRVSSVW